MILDSSGNPITDGWGNILTGLGRADRDKRMSATFAAPTLLSEQQANLLYVGDWRMARIVDRPALDQVRRWIDIAMDGRRDRADDLHARLRELGAKAAFRDGIAWARLHGTALGIMLVDDGQPQEEPLNIERVRKVEGLRVVDRWQVSVAEWDDEWRPLVYRLNTGGQLLDGQGQPIEPLVHATRTLRWEGIRTPPRRQRELGGWADAVVSRVYDVVRDYGQAIGGAAHLATDFAQAVLKIKGLAKMLAEDKDGAVLARLKALDMARSIARILPLDSEEEFDRKTTPVTGLPEILDRLRDELCGAADMPEKILFGQATAGLGDQGQSDLEQYYNGIEGEQLRNVLPQATALVTLLMRELKIGSDSWEVACCPLWSPSETELSENRLRDAQADEIRVRNSFLTPDEIRRSRYGGDGYGTELAIEEPEDDDGADDVVPTEPTGIDPTTGMPGGPGLNPETTLNGSQITAGTDIIARALSGEITVPAARVLLRRGLGLEPDDVEEMLEGIDEAIAEREKKAEEQAKQLAAAAAAAAPPGAPPGAKPGAKPKQPPKRQEQSNGEEDQPEE